MPYEEIQDVITKLIISIIIGLIIGAEREYRNKSAGLRTIILICLGSTLFTMLSDGFGDNTGTSRVAANIVTGIGFLGAGAIMREGLTISGLTTASTIWVAAALGMAVGTGEYTLALISMAFTFLVLSVFGKVQPVLTRFLKKTIELHLTLDSSENRIEEIEAQMTAMKLKFYRRKEFRKDDKVLYQYDVTGKEEMLNTFISFLNHQQQVRSFNY
jgi:putative Mg2+ transporter-C (MgtC) family protein